MNKSREFFKQINYNYKEKTRDGIRNLLTGFLTGFLLSCKRNIIPNDIKNNFNCLYSISVNEHLFQNQLDKIITNFTKKVLNWEHKITYWKIRKFKKDIVLSKNW